MAALTIDCADVSKMAQFYSAATGGDLGHNGTTVTVDGLLVIFREVSDHQAPTWPSADVPMQMHFEFTVQSLETAEAVLLDLGATKPIQPAPFPGAGPMVVLQDPAGHPFCIFPA